MRALAYGSILLAGALCRPAHAAPREQAPPGPAPSPAPPAPTPPPAPSTSEEEPAAPPTETPTLPASPQITAPFDDRRQATTLAVSSQTNVAPAAPAHRQFGSDDDALPLLFEARFGFNTRLSSSFGAASNEQLLDSTIGLGAYLSLSRWYALGLEFEHAGLGNVRDLSGQSALDAQYSVNGGWLAARVFPWRSERWDVYLNLRAGLVWQHVNALGTRQDPSQITVIAQSFSCTDRDGPNLGLGGALGSAFYLSRHFSIQARVDATAERLSGEALGACAAGIGSIATVSGTLGVGFEFETAPKR